MDESKLRERIIQELKEQGFKINPHLAPVKSNKETFRQIQQKARFEKISLHKKFLNNNFSVAVSYCNDGDKIIPNDISLELREVQSGSLEETLFRWWNLVWWSIPYQRPYGRQMRFLLWDKTHDSPFGLIGLQSPILRMSVRDEALEIPENEIESWVNKSMKAQRVGALPPYNDLIGGKMAALALTANEVREAYEKKYKESRTIIKNRILNELLFITTTSAFGRSSIYNRLKYKGELVAKSLGYTEGSGSFHISKGLYEAILDFLDEKGIDIARGFGHGPSRKRQLLSKGFKKLGLADFEFHRIKRELYLFPLVDNLKEVIRGEENPKYFDRPFIELFCFWKDRWGLPRSKREPSWKDFRCDKYFKKVKRMLKDL